MVIKSVHQHLCGELIEEILSRLPVKSLLRFRCVSKSWLSLINSKRFIEAHRQNSTQNRALSHHKVMFACGTGEFKQCPLQQFLNEPSSVKPCRIDAPTNIAAYYVKPINNDVGYDVVGCCKGLFCLFLHTPGVLVLWNPATRICMELPKLNPKLYCSSCSKFGFGWDGTSGAFKVYASSFTHGELNGNRGNIYSSKTNSWKAVDYGRSYSSNENVGLFASGKIHWFTLDDYIETFDLESEEFGRIELPTDKIYSELPPEEVFFDNLAEIGGRLHLLYTHIDDHIHSKVFVVWVLKESGWFKLYTFPPLFWNRSYAIRPPMFEEGPNGDILLILGDNFWVYDGKDAIMHQENKNVIEYLDYAGVYVETLVSPNFTTPS